MENKQLAGLQSQTGVTAAVVVTELDFKDTRSELWSAVRGESALRLSFEWPGEEDFAAFLDDVSGVSLQVFEGIALAARPFDFNLIGPGGIAQTKRQGELILRAVARTGMDGLPLGSVPGLDAHHGADAVAVRARADGLDPDGVPRRVGACR